MFPGLEHQERPGRESPHAHHACPGNTQHVRCSGVSTDVPGSSCSLLSEQRLCHLLQHLHARLAVWAKGQRENILQQMLWETEHKVLGLRWLREPGGSTQNRVMKLRLDQDRDSSWPCLTSWALVQPSTSACTVWCLLFLNQDVLIAGEDPSRRAAVTGDVNLICWLRLIFLVFSLIFDSVGTRGRAAASCKAALQKETMARSSWWG